MLLNLCLYASLAFWLFLCLVSLIPNTDYYFGFDAHPKCNNAKLPKTFRSSLLANRWLSSADHLFVNEIRGPESFAKWNDKVYTSLADGRVVEVLQDDLRNVAFLDPENRGLDECQKMFSAVKHCARPLGLRFSSDGFLYAIDPYHGIFKINVKNGQYWLIMDVKKHKLSDNDWPKFLDDLELVEENDGNMTIYMSDASQRWLLHDVFYTVGERDQTGRLLSFNTATGQLKVELEQLAFPNGLALTDDKSTILLNEFNKQRVLAYHIKGPYRNQYEVLIDGLPGEPDNIKRSLNKEYETYWIGLFTGRNINKPSFFLDHMICNHQFIVRAYYRLMRLVGFIIENIGNYLQNDLISQIGFDIRVGHPLFDMVANYGLAIEIDTKGNIVNSLHSPDGYTSALSEVFEYDHNEHERHFYLGSYSNKYLGKLSLKKIYDRKLPIQPKTTTPMTEEQNQPQILEKKPEKLNSKTTSSESNDKRSVNRHQEL